MVFQHGVGYKSGNWVRPNHERGINIAGAWILVSRPNRPGFSVVQDGMIAAPFAWAQVSETTTTTTTTTEGSGTITEFTPGSPIVLKESAGPKHYRFGKTVTYVTRSGKMLDEATVKAKIRVGAPVRVHYVTEGSDMLIDRVILDED